jgi:hypothetical protein
VTALTAKRQRKRQTATTKDKKKQQKRQKWKTTLFFHRLPHPIGFAVTALTAKTKGNSKDKRQTTTNNPGLPRNFFKISRNDGKW